MQTTRQSIYSKEEVIRLALQGQFENISDNQLRDVYKRFRSMDDMRFVKEIERSFNIRLDIIRKNRYFIK